MASRPKRKSQGENAKALIRHALELATEDKDRSIELARYLAEIQAMQPLTDFIRHSGISRRKAYFLAEIGRKLTAVDATVDRLTKIGWTKLQIVLRHVEGRPSSELLDLAETHNAHQLKQMLPKKPPPSKSKCVVLYFSPGQYAAFRNAILEYGGKSSGRGLIGKEDAVIAMIGSLNSSHS